MTYSRREFLRCLALGGAVVAGELWIPGQRVISLPDVRATDSWRDVIFDIAPNKPPLESFGLSRYELVESIRVYRTDWGTLDTRSGLATRRVRWQD